MKQGYSIDYKIKTAETAINHEKNHGTFKDIAVIAGVNPNVVTRWVREYRAGKLIPEEKKLDVAEERLSLLRSIDRSLKTIITLLDPPLPDDLMSKLDDEFNGD